MGFMKARELQKSAQRKKENRRSEKQADVLMPFPETAHTVLF
jgi:hypothetical protein